MESIATQENSFQLPTPGTATIKAEDSQGVTAFATVNVVSGFTIYPEDRQLLYGRMAEIKTVGATAPVSFAITTNSQYATLSGNIFTAGTTQGVVIVTATDALGLEEQAIFPLPTK